MKLNNSQVLLLCMLIVLSKAALKNDYMTPIQAAIAGAALFSEVFQKVIREEGGGNFITSPLGANIMLSMAALGAGGNTKKEMSQVLHFQAGDDFVRAGYHSFINTLSSFQSVEIKIVNKIFISDNIRVKPAFEAMAAANFLSEIERLDFSNSARAASTINNWCASRFDLIMKNVIAPDSLDPETGMILVNAVYFKGQWKNFNPLTTCERTFYIDGQTTKTVPTMYQVDDMLYGVIPSLEAKFVEVPYKGGQVSMFIVLADNTNALSRAEKFIKKNSLDTLRNCGNFVKVMLRLPRFRIESTIELDDVLSEMGMRDMFSESANFGGISEDSLKGSKVFQKAFIQVDEEGYEPVARIGEGATLMAYNIPIEFDVNRPFMYFVISYNYGNPASIILNGRVMDPTLE